MDSLNTQAEPTQPELDPRTANLLDNVNPAGLLGLEIGALANPAVTRAMGDIRYLDFAGSETLRANHKDHVHIDLERIVDVDYALDGRSIAEAVGPDIRFDYVIASHVAEHVPDLIGWMRDLHDVLTPGGVVVLALPDKRRCFDILRNTTVLADVIAAHLSAARRPTPRQVFDHHASAMLWNGMISWLSDPPLDELRPVRSEEQALEIARRADIDDDYNDVHCWVFTPDSFVELMGALRQLALVPFDVVRCTETIGIEFFVTLAARHASDHIDRANEAGEAGSGGPVMPVIQRQALAAEAERNRELDDLRGRLDDATAAFEQTRAQLDATRAALEETYATTSWRITRPLRRLNLGLARIRTRLHHD